MKTLTLRRKTYWRTRQLVIRLKTRIAFSDSGEGVISAAIAVLIMAFLGVAMWLAFKAMLGTTTTAVSHAISKIGQ